MVIIPATSGQMGVLPGHMASIAELKPGLLSVHEGNSVSKYFVSSGFAFIHANSVTDIIAVEAVPIDRIDPSLVQQGLAEFNQKLNTASTDLEKAEAQIGITLHTATFLLCSSPLFFFFCNYGENPALTAHLLDCISDHNRHLGR